MKAWPDLAFVAAFFAVAFLCAFVFLTFKPGTSPPEANGRERPETRAIAKSAALFSAFMSTVLAATLTAISAGGISPVLRVAAATVFVVLAWQVYCYLGKP